MPSQKSLVWEQYLTERSCLQPFLVCPCRSITVKGLSGQNVTLPCMYDMHSLGKCEICWMRGIIPLSGCGDEIIATDGDKVVRQTSQRHQLNGELQKGDASLTIYNTTEKDSGQYGCRVHVPGWFNDEKSLVYLAIMKGTYSQCTGATILILKFYHIRHITVCSSQKLHCNYYC